MIEFDQQVTEVSEDTNGTDEKVVPVSEAIRYRKRAQQAEKELTQLKQQLEDSQRHSQSLARQMETMEEEQQLKRCVVEAGAKDVETAMLVVKSCLEKNREIGATEAVELMRKEKGYLFERQTAAEGLSKTLGARQKMPGQRGLESGAQKAVQSGTRVDLLEYMRMRRKYV